MKIRYRLIDPGKQTWGLLLVVDPNRPGFFLFAADPVNNNVRLFAMSTSVREVRFL
jgi:hypothetical protein